MLNPGCEQDTGVSQKEFSRREVLKLGGVATVLGVAASLAGKHIAQSQAATTNKVKYGFVVDLERCFGCRACVEACKVENNTGQGIFWMHVFQLETGKYPHVSYLFMPRNCQHCDNAPCVKVCPVGARYKREDGLVLTDYKRCIGCRYCEVACPYSVNYFNWKKPEKNQYFDWSGGEGDDIYGNGGVRDYIGDTIPPYQNPDHARKYGNERRRSLVSGGGHFKGVIEKCTWCVHRIEKNLLPACVANCPQRALSFGDLNDPESRVSSLLATRRWFRLLEEHGTEPSTYYLGGTPPSHLFKSLLQALSGERR